MKIAPKRSPLYLFVLLLVLSADLSIATAQADNLSNDRSKSFELIPTPRQIQVFEDVFRPSEEVIIRATGLKGEGAQNTIDHFQKLLRKRGLSSKISEQSIEGRHTVDLNIRPELVPHSEGYRISVSEKNITLSANDAAGLHYAVLTFSQILEQIPPGRAIPRMKIDDWPDFANRGIMLDISRDKVPTIESLYEQVDFFASWKINQLQLYTEHAFAYEGHEQIWKDASPMTAEQVRALDAYCRERFIELVPNQNSFGHMERWLKHEPYRQFAEAPDGYKTGETFHPPTALCATDPRSIALVEDLLGQLIPNFTSGQINVGCDETHDLGQVRTKELCEQIGHGRVYLDFLLKIHAVTQKHGKVMQFWGDIIKHYPELIPELPENVIAMIWGYRPEHPYDEDCRKFRASGIPFYVCPGTSSWLSFSGRTQRGLTNISNAIENGKKYGAIGVLTTKWGDRGYWQSHPSPFPAYIYSAGLSWCVDTNREADVISLLNRYVYRDKSGITGRVVYEIGNAYAAAEGYYNGNTSYLARSLLDPEMPLTNPHFNWITEAKLKKIRAYIDQTMQPIKDAAPRSEDGDLVVAELRHSAEIVRLSCDVLSARLAATDGRLINAPKDERRKLAERLKALIKNHETLWLKRNRIGGLSDSSSRMDPLLKLLES